MRSGLLPTHERFVPRRPTFWDRLKLWASPVTSQPGFKPQAIVITIIVLILLGARHLVVQDAEEEAALIKLAQQKLFNFYDLNRFGGYPNGQAMRDRVLICIPLRDAEHDLTLMWGHLANLTYPHKLIDLAFLVSDSTDNTASVLATTANQAFSWPEPKRFRSIDIYYKDFGARIGQGFDDRHNVAVQGERRKLMGRARNWLLTSALRPDHSWVHWRDADIETAPPTLIQDLMQFDQDVIVPNVWRPLPKWLGGDTQQPYDLNSWQESDPALELASRLDEDDVIVEGYAEYPTWRVHLAYLRNENGEGDPREMIPLDGIGGVSILARAKVFRSGCMFSGFAFANHAETEGFGKMARRMDFTVAGLSQYTIWHKYEPSSDDLIIMRNRIENGLPID